MEKLLQRVSAVDPSLRRVLFWSLFPTLLTILFTTTAETALPLSLAVAANVVVGGLCLSAVWLQWAGCRTFADLLATSAHLVCLSMYGVTRRNYGLQTYPCLPAALHLLHRSTVSSMPIQLCAIVGCVVVPSVCLSSEFFAPVPIAITVFSVIIPIASGSWTGWAWAGTPNPQPELGCCPSLDMQASHSQTSRLFCNGYPSAIGLSTALPVGTHPSASGCLAGSSEIAISILEVAKLPMRSAVDKECAPPGELPVSSGGTGMSLEQISLQPAMNHSVQGDPDAAHNIQRSCVPQSGSTGSAFGSGYALESSRAPSSTSSVMLSRAHHPVSLSCDFSKFRITTSASDFRRSRTPDASGGTSYRPLTFSPCSFQPVEALQRTFGGTSQASTPGAERQCFLEGQGLCPVTPSSSCRQRDDLSLGLQPEQPDPGNSSGNGDSVGRGAGSEGPRVVLTQQRLLSNNPEDRKMTMDSKVLRWMLPHPGGSTTPVETPVSPHTSAPGPELGSDNGVLDDTSSLSSVSHDIRTPLTTALSVLQIVMDADSMDEEDRRDLLQKAWSALQLAITLVNNLLDMNKLRSAQMRVVPKRVSTRSLAIGVLRILEVQAMQQKTELVLDVSPNVPSCVLCDRVLLQ
eukprot:RCo031640